MKSFINMLGILLIIGGIGALAYKGYTYTEHETVAQIGDLTVTADTQKSVYFSPIYGAIALVAGIALVVIARKK